MLYLTKMGYMEYKPPGSVDSELSSAVGNVEPDPSDVSGVNLMLVKYCLGLYTDEVWIMTSIHHHAYLPSHGKEDGYRERPSPWPPPDLGNIQLPSAQETPDGG